jgi:hypothetical protein
MSLFSSYESLDYFLQEFINKIDEIEAWHAVWATNERIQSGLRTVEAGMTNKACLFIVISAQSVHAAVQVVQTLESGTLPRLLADGIGIDQCGMLERFDDERGLGYNRTESQLRVTLKVLRDSRQAVQQFADNLLDLLVKGTLGQQARLWVEDYVTLHLEQMNNGFLMLRGLLEHDLGRRFADVPILIHRLERSLLALKSVFVLPPLPSDHG